MQNNQQQHEAEGEKVKEYADIIEFKLDGKDYPDSQGARVGPNQRLKIAFGIDNAFTNPNNTAKNVFGANTMKLMRGAIKLDKENTTGDWSDMRTYTMNCRKEYLQRASNSGCLNLSELVQFVTLKVSLYYLFPGEASNTDDTFKDMVYIGHRINELWIASKTTEAGRPRWADEKELHDALQRVTTRIPSNSPPDTSLAAHAAPHQTGQYAVTSVLGYIWGCVEWIKDWLLGRTTEREDNTLTNDTHATPDPEIPSRNPMNLILPAYETMWRAVMRCFLEIRSATQETDLSGLVSWKSISKIWRDPMTRNPNTSGSHLQLESSPWTLSRKLCVCTHPHDVFTATSTVRSAPQISRSASDLNYLLELTRCYSLQNVGKISGLG
jgi:hypothetical protein